MMTIYDLKPAFQRLLRPLCHHLAAAGVTANQLTVTAALGSMLIGGLFAANPNARWAALLIPIWLFVRMALNALDGMLAREHDMQSALGGILNELGDVVSDAALFLPFACITGINASFVVATVVLAICTEMTGVVAVQIGASRRYDGPMGKSDRAFVFGFIALLIGLGINIHPWVNWGLSVVAVLCVVTMINRARKALVELNR